MTMTRLSGLREKIAIVVGLIMAVGAWAAFLRFGPPPQPTAEIPVAARDIQAFETITPSDLDWKTIPADAVDPAWITSPDEVLGKAARTLLLSGEPIHAGKLMRAEEVLGGRYRMVAIPTDLISAAGGHVQPDDRVDLYHVPAGAAAPVTLLQSNVKVLDIRTMSNKPYRIGGTTSGGVTVSIAGEQLVGDGSAPAIVVLKLEPRIIPTILRAAETGKIALVKRAGPQENDAPTISGPVEPAPQDGPADSRAGDDAGDDNTTGGESYSHDAGDDGID